MFIAHLPSGYIFAKHLYNKFQPTLISKKTFFTTILAGAVFPDLDLFYFYLLDERSVHHHKYFFHWPLLWLLLGIISFIIFRLSRQKNKWALMGSLFCSAIMIHVVLDTFVGEIWWLMPFVDQSYAVFHVPAVQSHWVLNFVLHWSFVVELCICSYALWLFIKK